MQSINATSIVNSVLTVAQNTAEEFDISEFNTPDKRILLMPEAGATFHILFTKETETTDADADDFLIPSTGFDVVIRSRIGRISVFNSSSGSKKLYIATMQ